VVWHLWNIFFTKRILQDLKSAALWTRRPTEATIAGCISNSKSQHGGSERLQLVGAILLPSSDCSTQTQELKTRD